MILLTTQKINLQKSVNLPQKKNSKVFYKNLEADTFVRTSINFGNNTQKKEIETFIDRIEQNQVKESGKGWQAKFYKMNDTIGIKAPSANATSGDISGKNNIGEFFILQHLNKISPDIAPKPFELVEKPQNTNQKPKNYLAMEIVNGSAINENNLTKDHLNSIIGHLFTLEKEGIMHFDLQNENILLENPSKTKLIDFGSFGMLDNNGNIVYSEHAVANDNTAKFFADLKVDASAQQKRSRNFISKVAVVYIPTQKNNPHTNFHSCVQSFEYRTLHDVMITKAKANPQEAKDFFKSYLQTKANSFHYKMKEFLSSVKIDDFKKPEDTSEDIQKAKDSLQKAIRHEEVSEEVLKNPSENVIKTELAKMQLRYWSAGNYNSLNGEAIINLHKDFVKNTQESIKNASPAEKEYYENSLLSMDSLKNYDKFKTNHKKLSDSEDILFHMFGIKRPDDNPNPPEPPKPPTPPEPPKSNKKLYAIIAGALAIGGILLYLLLKNKENNKEKN